MVSLCTALGQNLPKLQALSPTVTLLVSHLSLRGSLGQKPLITTLVSGWRRSFSSQSSGLLLDLPRYSQMRDTLAGRKGDLGVLESAGLFILDMENLRVNATVLDLNLTSVSIGYKGMAKYEEIKKLKATGVIKVGKYTSGLIMTRCVFPDFNHSELLPRPVSSD